MEKTIAASVISIVKSNPSIQPSGAGHVKAINAGRPLSPSDHDVRVVSLSEYKEAAACLAEAFADDHTARYFIDTPDREHWTDAQKWDLHVEMMEYITYAHLLKGLVLTAGPDYGCVALWMPPGQNMDDYPTILRSGMWRLHYKLSCEGKARFFSEFLPLLHETKKSVLGPRDGDSYYLVYVGTRASARGRGYARKVIDEVTRRADAEGRACYLESSNDVNPIIYGKLGFGVAKKVYLTRAEEAVELDIMVRDPVRKEAASGREQEKAARKPLMQVKVAAGTQKLGSVRAFIA
ncbi:hypothetical protein LTR66_008654 [Elasticomyces elasticus]|nr:hypothetical protein LTR66_008654 [Elasticomyces elasticus]